MNPIESIINQINCVQEQTKLEELTQSLLQSLDQLHFQNPAYSATLIDLAERVKPISPKIATDLAERANVDFPEDLLHTIIKQALQLYPREEFLKEAARFRATSKGVRELALEAIPKCPISAMGLSTADRAIGFVKLFGDKLSILDISLLDFTAEQLNELLIYLPNITEFTAQTCNITNGALVITSSKNLKNLQKLDLEGNKMGMGACTLAVSEHLKNLRILNLGGNAIEDIEVEFIASSAVFRNLTHLDLVVNQSTEEGAQAIAASKTLTKLQSLNLAVNQIGPAGARALVTSPAMTNLETLSLGRNQIGVEGVYEIARAIRLPSLRELRLEENGLSAENGEAISRSPSLQKVSVYF